MPKTPTPFTPAQQAVIAHERGPALVFAAAGSGKTTTMVARIERLVRQRIVAPDRILATSFNRAAAGDIERALRQRKVKGVQVKTLHSLGYGIVAEAAREGLARVDRARSRHGFEGLERRLLNRTLAEARRQRIFPSSDLNRLDFDEFLDYLARCKGNLAYADLAAARLPLAARSVATQAGAPADRPIYLPLYRLYESIRQQLGWITYDDMLLLGWEVLVRHPQVLARVQAQYQSVLVDEFQDVNLAQVQMVDMLSRGHRNLMVIGDDDQTIYEWRGAAAHFLLNFQRQPDVRVYVLEENFRCRASQVALANAVIRHNVERSDKQIRLTRGFGGSTVIQRHGDEAAMGAAIAEEIERLRRRHRLDRMAVLVRLFAQTAPIEAALLRAGIPHVVEGDLPFHQRPEQTALLDYVRLGEWEAQLLAGRHLSAAQAGEFHQAWQRVANRPLRYMARSIVDSCADAVTQRGQSLSGALTAAAPQAHQSVADRMRQLAADLRWLAGEVGKQQPAHQLLCALEARLGYADALAKESGGEALGWIKATAVHAFVDLAKGKGSLAQFRRFLRGLAKTDQGRTAVTLTTIHRAKGLEWSCVFVPGCNQDVIPYERGASVAEERRLLYVAITRAKEHLALHALCDRPLSAFLEEAGVEAVLRDVERVRSALAVDPGRWSTDDALLVAAGCKRFGFADYVARWWEGPRRRAAARITGTLESSPRRTLTALGLGAGDLHFWRAVAEGARQTGNAKQTPTRRQRWSRTRRNVQEWRGRIVDGAAWLGRFLAKP